MSAAEVPAVRTQSLTKSYGGARGIIGIDLEVQRGEVFGLLGPNGAGKSTLLRCLLDLIRPTSGSAQVLGSDVRIDGMAVRRQVGYLPGEFALWPRLSAGETLAFAHRLRGGSDRARTARLAERFHLDLERPVAQMSRGNKQKVGLLLALMPMVDLYILDEPTGGLDPLMQQQFREVVDEEVERGATVLLSSHVMHEVEHLAHRVGVVREGRLVVVERVDALRSRAARPVSVTFSDQVPTAAFEGLAGVEVLQVHHDTVNLRVTGSMDPLIKALAQHDVITLNAPEADLEDIFLDFYGSAGAA